MVQNGGVSPAELGLWECLLELVQKQQGVAFGMTFLDGTNIRAHHKAVEAQKRFLSKNTTIVKYLVALGPVRA